MAGEFLQYWSAKKQNNLTEICMRVIINKTCLKII